MQVLERILTKSWSLGSFFYWISNFREHFLWVQWLAIRPWQCILGVLSQYIKKYETPKYQCCSWVHPYESKTKTESWVTESKNKTESSASESESSVHSKSESSISLFFFIIILLSKDDQNYKFTEIFYFHNVGHICQSQDGLVLSPRVIKARDRVQDRVIDI